MDINFRHWMRKKLVSYNLSIFTIIFCRYTGCYIQRDMQRCGENLPSSDKHHRTQSSGKNQPPKEATGSAIPRGDQEYWGHLNPCHQIKFVWEEKEKEKMEWNWITSRRDNQGVACNDSKAILISSRCIATQKVTSYPLEHITNCSVAVAKGRIGNYARRTTCPTQMHHSECKKPSDWLWLFCRKKSESVSGVMEKLNMKNWRYTSYN